MARDVKALTQALIYLEIIKRIPRHRCVCAKDIQQSLDAADIHVPMLTLQRYLKSLCDSEVLPIQCNRSSRPYSYRLSPEETPLWISEPTPQESLLLKLAQEHLKFQLPSHLSKSFEPIFDLAQRSLDTRSKAGREKDWIKKVAVVFNSLPQIPPKVLPRHFDAISDALFREKKIHIQYCNSRREVKDAVVSPLGLVQQDVRLYLVCQFEGYDNIRHLAMHRLKTVDVLEDNAVKVEGFDVRSYVKSKTFNYSDDDVRRVHLILEFSNDQTALNLQEAPFNRTQTIDKLENGHYQLQVDIEDNLLLDGWINTWKKVAGIVQVEKIPLE